MLDDILKLIIEVALDGAIEASGGKKKAILIGLAALVWLTAVILFLWVGIAEHDISLSVLAVVLFVILVSWVFFKTKCYLCAMSPSAILSLSPLGTATIWQSMNSLSCWSTSRLPRMYSKAKTATFTPRSGNITQFLLRIRSLILSSTVSQC